MFDYDIVEIAIDNGAVTEALSTSRSEYTPAWIPPGDRFVYVSERAGTDQLRVHVPGDDRDEPLYSPGRQGIRIAAPTPSPDRSRVAFYLVDPDGGVSIWIVPSAGGAAVRLTNSSDAQMAPEWSPDGESIAFLAVRDGRVRLAVARVGQVEPPREIAAPGVELGSDSPPAWSPDGRWIAYAPPAGLRLVSPDGRQTRTLTSIEHKGIAWSRDSRTIYTTLRSEDGLLLRRISVDDGSVRTLAVLPPRLELGAPMTPGLRLTWSADGKRLLTSTGRNETDIWILDNFAPRISVWERLRTFVRR
jgi:Tol biopolymer transport system component